MSSFARPRGEFEFYFQCSERKDFNSSIEVHSLEVKQTCSMFKAQS